LLWAIATTAQSRHHTAHVECRMVARNRRNARATRILCKLRSICSEEPSGGRAASIRKQQ
jgi:hypothetical protein